MAGSTVILNPFGNTFGLPPASYVSDTQIINSMPVIEINPGEPNFEAGTTLFTINDTWDKYIKLLNTLDFSLTSKSVRLAFLADSFPTDTFTNEYGETFLQKFTDVASQGMQQISQMTGSKSFTEAVGKLGGAFTNIGEDVGGGLGGLIKGAGGGFEATGKGLESLKTSMQGNKFFSGAAGLIDKMLAGNRVDFPMIWRNSGFSPSYTITVRLYNPNPASPESTNRHIVGPLAVILCLAIPRSDDGKSFNWPFFHNIKASGIYNLSPAVITNVTVIKGGDQQQISFNQKLAMVDVRIDFTSLYGTMVLETSKTNERSRPTVRNYLSSLLENDETLSFSRNEVRIASARVAGEVGNLQSGVLISSKTPTVSEENLVDKNEAARRRQAPTLEVQAVSDRVSSKINTQQNSLIDLSPQNFINEG